MPNLVLTIYLVDDDADIRSALTRGLELRGYAVEAYASATKFLASLDPQRPGVILLDYGLPGMNGLEVQARLIERGVDLPIIFITGHGGVPESVQAIKAGALDFLEKPFRQAVLLERVEAGFALLLARESDRMAGRAREALFAKLTAREAEIVRLIVENPAEVSSKEVAARLGISPRTVDHHRARILEKLGVRSLAELIALVKG